MNRPCVALGPGAVVVTLAAAVVSMGLPVAVTLASDVAEGGWVVPAEVLYGVINVYLKLNSSFKSKV